jgi:hypothetical protein
MSHWQFAKATLNCPNVLQMGSLPTSNFGVRVNQQQPTHHEGWMMNGWKKSFFPLGFSFQANHGG